MLLKWLLLSCEIMPKNEVLISLQIIKSIILYFHSAEKVPFNSNSYRDYIVRKNNHKAHFLETACSNSSEVIVKSFLAALKLASSHVDNLGQLD